MPVQLAIRNSQWKKYFSLKRLLFNFLSGVVQPLQLFFTLLKVSICSQTKSNQMALEVLTKEDLNSFKSELFSELSRLIAEKQPLKKEQREWLKSYEVMKMLNLSKGKLQSLRISGKLAFTRIGHCIYYKYGDITQLMEENKIKNPVTSGVKGRNRFSLP